MLTWLNDTIYVIVVNMFVPSHADPNYSQSIEGPFEYEIDPFNIQKEQVAMDNLEVSLVDISYVEILTDMYKKGPPACVPESMTLAEFLNSVEQQLLKEAKERSGTVCFGLGAESVVTLSEAACEKNLDMLRTFQLEKVRAESDARHVFPAYLRWHIVLEPTVTSAPTSGARAILEYLPISIPGDGWSVVKFNEIKCVCVVNDEGEPHGHIVDSLEKIFDLFGGFPNHICLVSVTCVICADSCFFRYRYSHCALIKSE